MVEVIYSDGSTRQFAEANAWENEPEGDLVLFKGDTPVRGIARGRWWEVCGGPDQGEVE